MQEKWVLRRRTYQELADRLKIPPVLAHVIRNRVSEDEAEKYLDREGPLEDPFLMKGMEEACDILLQARQEKVQIRVVGDYDVDGVTATAILYLGLSALGFGVSYRIPDRMEDGYGIRKHMVDEAIEEGCALILTCDNGIREFETMTYAKEKGIPVVLTDHHEITQDADGHDILPDAACVIDPHRQDDTYPCKDLCGAGVAFKLVQGLAQRTGGTLPASLIGFAALGSVCDVVKLVGENRRIVWQGLKQWNQHPPVGIAALMDAAMLKNLTVYSFGFVIGPMINAGGRLKNQQSLIRILLTEDPAEAYVLAQELKRLNEERQNMTQAGIEEASLLVETALKDDIVKVLHLEDLHESIAGLVAGRIKERYYRPAIVFSGTDELVKGSGRSIEGYDLFRHLQEQDALLERYGGHPLAAGLSIQKDRIGELRRALNEQCDIPEDKLYPTVVVDAMLPLADADLRLAGLLTQLEPFGTGNERPVFAAMNVEVLSLRLMGRKQNVCRLQLLQDGRPCEAITFRVEALQEVISTRYGTDVWDRLRNGARAERGICIDLLYHLEINEFRGMTSAQCTICNIR